MAEAAQENRREIASNTSELEWSRVIGQLKEEIGDTAYRSWLAPINVERVDGGEAVIAAPARLYRDWVASHYADRILTLWRAENRQVKRISVVVAAPSRGSHALPAAADSAMGPLPQTPVSLSEKPAAPSKSARIGLNLPVLIRASPLRISWSASRMNWRTRRRGGSPKRVPPHRGRCRSIRFFCTAASASAKPI